MNILFIKSTWGMEGSLAKNLTQIKHEGFDGVETNAPPSAAVPHNTCWISDTATLPSAASIHSTGLRNGAGPSAL
jgi:hypothetical protein